MFTILKHRRKSFRVVSSSSATNSLSEGLVRAYLGEDLTDELANANLTVRGTTPSSATGKNNNSYNYPNNGGHVTDWFPDGNPWTISTWMYADVIASTDFTTIVGCHDANDRRVYWGFSKSDHIVMACGDSYAFDEAATYNTGTWYNFIIRWDGTNAWCFVDGQLRIKFAASFSGTSTDPLHLGERIYNAGAMFSVYDGRQDETYIWNRALDVGSASSVGDTGGGDIANLQSLFYASFDTALDSDVLLYVPFTDADASTGADGYVLSSGAHTLTTDVFARAGNAVINTDQTKMDGSGTAAYNPAGANSDGWVLDSTISTGLEVGTASPLSIQFWFYCSNDASNSYGRLLSWGGYHDSGSGFEIETYNFDYDNFIFYEHTGSANNRRSLGTYQLTANAWNHIYWAFQPSGSSYVGINGTVTEISNSYISDFAPTVDLHLLKTAGNNDDSVKGYVQEFIVKNTVPYIYNFTPTTVSLLNNFPTTNLVAFYKLDESSGDALDFSGNGRTFTENGTVASTTGSIGGQTVNVRTLDKPAGKYFSRADDDNLDVGDGESFTISFWAKLSSSMGNYNSGGIFSKRNGAGASDAGYSIDLKRSNSDVYIRYNGVSDGSTTVGDTNTDTGIATDAWAHYMMVFTADATVITYVNNAQYSSVDASSVTGSLANSIPSYIGQRMHNSAGDIIADVSHIGFWKKALTSTERAAVYNSGKVFAPGAPVPLQTRTVTFDSSDAAVFTIDSDSGQKIWSDQKLNQASVYDGLRLWNGSEAGNSGATADGTKWEFSSNGDCTTWWDNYWMRVKQDPGTGTFSDWINLTGSDGLIKTSCQAEYNNIGSASHYSGPGTWTNHAAGFRYQAEIYSVSSRPQ